MKVTIQLRRAKHTINKTLQGLRKSAFNRCLGCHKILQLELPNLVTLSLLAWGSATERELRLWNVMVRLKIMTSIETLMTNGGFDDDINGTNAEIYIDKITEIM